MLEVDFDLVGEELCLDFTNTVGGCRGVDFTEKLHSYAHLLSWGAQAGSISAAQAERLLTEAEQYPDGADAVLAFAIDMRETLFRIFNAVAHEAAPNADDIATFNIELARAMAHVQVEAHGDHFHWAWQDSGDLDSVLWEVLRSAANLLTTPERLQWIHQCSSDHCDWLFVDTTKNHSRRWCDMKSCGNLHKVRKHRQRQTDN